MKTASFIFALLGAAGLGGYAELGEGLIPSLILITASLALYYTSTKRGGKKYKRINHNFINCHDYPAGLYASRRA